MDLLDRDILQINATIIAGALIFLTFISLGERTGTSDEIATSTIRVIVSLAIVIWFSLSSIHCIRGNHTAAMNTMVQGFGIIFGMAIILMGFTLYEFYTHPQEQPISMNQTK